MMHFKISLKNKLQMNIQIFYVTDLCVDGQNEAAAFLLDAPQLVVVGGLQPQVVPQHEVYRPAVALLHPSALAQSGPGRQQQDGFHHAQLLLSAIQDPLRHLVCFPAPSCLRQAALLQRDPEPDGGGRHLGAPSRLSNAVTQRGEDDDELIVGQRTDPLLWRNNSLYSRIIIILSRLITAPHHLTFPTPVIWMVMAGVKGGEKAALRALTDS